MLQFILGVFIGGIVGFIVCAICSIASDDKANSIQSSKIAGESDDRK